MEPGHSRWQSRFSKVVHVNGWQAILGPFSTNSPYGSLLQRLTCVARNIQLPHDSVAARYAASRSGRSRPSGAADCEHLSSDRAPR